MIRIPGTDVQLPAVMAVRCDSSQATAWTAAGYQTVRLVDRVDALRVHARGGTAAATKPGLASAGRQGRWFAIGDVVLTREQYAGAHALPGGFSHQDLWILAPGTVLNVGVAAALFGHAGGAVQGEFVSGPAPTGTPIAGFWSSRQGRA